MRSPIPPSSLFWTYLGVFLVLQFLAALIFVALQVRQRRYARLLLSIPLMLVSYLLFQMLSDYIFREIHFRWIPGFVLAFLRLPMPLILAAAAALTLCEVLIFLDHLRYERRTITPRSVKEATDSLPSGICCWLEDGRILMKNPAAERFCRLTAGTELTNGRVFTETLFTKDLAPGCSRSDVDGTAVITLPDGTVWQATRQEVPFEERQAVMLQIDEITEVWRRTQELQAMTDELSGLNRHLARVNREIVDVTAQHEVLAARIHIHDELGGILLSVRRYLAEGGDEQALSDIRERLGQTLSFLHTGRRSSEDGEDGYAQLVETAADLGVTVRTEGTLPETEPQRAILTAALHECLTNTIRHAHGDDLSVRIAEEAGRFTAVFTNNGTPPSGPVRETGGLGSLRTLAEKAGGTMTVAIRPAMSITITLPKEVPYAAPRTDRG